MRDRRAGDLRDRRPGVGVEAHEPRVNADVVLRSHLGGRVRVPACFAAAPPRGVASGRSGASASTTRSRCAAGAGHAGARFAQSRPASRPCGWKPCRSSPCGSSRAGTLHLLPPAATGWAELVPGRRRSPAGSAADALSRAGRAPRRRSAGPRVPSTTKALDGSAGGADLAVARASRVPLLVERDAEEARGPPPHADRTAAACSPTPPVKTRASSPPSDADHRGNAARSRCR